MPTWKLEIEYEGTRYRGWQIQHNSKTVQGELMDAARELFESRVEIGGAGRTDAGVHALRQIAHLKAPDLKRIVGMLAEVGRGNLSYDGFQRLIKFNSPEAPAKFTAPPSGLFLEKVLYKGDEPPNAKRSVVSIQ